MGAYALKQKELKALPFSKEGQNKRTKKAKDCFAFFCKIYFPHYIKADSKSTFQAWAFDALPTAINEKIGVKVAVAAPRGEAKSTIITRLLVLWCVVFEKKKMMIIAMNAYEQALEMLESIKVELDSNAILANDFPSQMDEGPLWRQGQIITKGGIKLKSQERAKASRRKPWGEPT